MEEAQTLPAPAPVTAHMPAQPLVGFGGTVQPSDEARQAFVSQAMQMAHAAPNYAANDAHAPLNRIVQELASNGLPEEAAALDQHLQTYGAQGDFYKGLNAWLAAIETRSPETFQHITRQAVLLGMCAKQAYQNAPQREHLYIQAAFAGMLHDIGKLSIDPTLLHKSTRLDRAEMERALMAYQTGVADYPEKLADLQFLRYINGGRIPFAKEPSIGADTADSASLLKLLDQQPLRGEPDFADPTILASAEQIYARIHARAQASGIALFTPAQEAALLNRGRRGTLTEPEGKVMSVHDKIGIQMVEALKIPPEIGLEPNVMNMDKAAGALIHDPRLAQMRQWVALSDVAEAVTGERAYNRENGKNLTPDEAMVVLNGEVKRGQLDAGTLTQFHASQILPQFAATYHDIPTQRQTPQLQIQASTVQPDRVGLMASMAQSLQKFAGGWKMPQPSPDNAFAR